MINECRQSNIELLRIVSMILIVVHHLCAHGVMHLTDTTNRLITWNAGTVFNKWFTASLYPGGEIGVAIFFMIAGYFGIKREKGSILKTSVQTVFYGILIGLVYGMTCLLNISFEGQKSVDTLKEVFRNIVTPVTGGGTGLLQFIY